MARVTANGVSGLEKCPIAGKFTSEQLDTLEITIYLEIENVMNNVSLRYKYQTNASCFSHF